MKKNSSSSSEPCILAIESSCDDTSASVIINGIVRSNTIANQEIHSKYGGVIPELASRQHQENIIPVVHEALRQAQINKADLDAIAFTQGPGLLGSLLVGSSFAKSMAMSLDIPVITVHHMEAHILAHFIEKPFPSFPFLCLTVSGGHTQIVKVDDYTDMTVLGNTRDDAAGEAFDKIGKYLGLDYPAGPIIDKLAQQGTAKYNFPKPQVDGYEFSFSGLKTSVLYFLRDAVRDEADFIKNNLQDICASVQKVIVDILIEKIVLAAKNEDIKEIAISGGVSANSGLRKAITEKGQELGWHVYIPQMQYCTDNAAMIAMSAHYKYLRGDFANLSVTPNPRQSF